MSNTKTIARNTGWYGLENAINSILTVFTSIAIARTLGPAKMGYIIYVTWIASVVADLGGLGIPATTRKYMAEFLGMGDRGTARHIYIRTLLLQGGLATFAVAALMIWVLQDAGQGYKLASALIVLSIWPAMSGRVRQSSSSWACSSVGSMKVRASLTLFLPAAAASPDGSRGCGVRAGRRCR